MARVKEFSDSEAWAKFFLNSKKLETVLCVSVCDEDGAVTFTAAVQRLDADNLVYVESSDSHDSVETVETHCVLEMLSEAAFAALVAPNALISGELEDVLTDALDHVFDTPSAWEDMTADEQARQMRLEAELSSVFMASLWDAHAELTA